MPKTPSSSSSPRSIDPPHYLKQGIARQVDVVRRVLSLTAFA